MLADAGLPVTDLRVRGLGDTVRLEIDALLVDRVAAHPEIRRALAAAGYGDLPHHVEPFRSGRLNLEP